VHVLRYASYQPQHCDENGHNPAKLCAKNVDSDLTPATCRYFAPI